MLNDNNRYLALYYSYFHTAYPNNYVHLLIPKRYDKAAYLAALKEKTKPLNEADYSLYKYCLTLLKDKPCQFVDDWGEAITSGKNLLAVYPAEKLIKFIEINILKSSIKVHLEQTAPSLLKKFIEIPQELLQLMRINFYLEHEKIEQALEMLLNKIHANSMLAEKLERIEIAKEGILNKEDFNYPTLIIYFNAKAIGSDLQYFLSEIADLARKQPGVKANPEYAYLWFPHVTVTQGYKLYKRYLRFLGIFSEIYDFAFVKSESQFWKNQLAMAKQTIINPIH